MSVSMISQGDTFWAKDFAEGVDSHLLIVISDPVKNPDELVLVTLTTWERDKDDSCYLMPGDHPFIKHDTCVQYNGFARTVSVMQLERVIAQGELVPREPVSARVLQKILEGAGDTRFLTNHQLRILDEQELID